MAKRKQAKNRKQIKRTTRHFQLRVDHPKDMHVREVLDFARSQRREVTMIRDAITLYYALENGNLEMLFEMFPTFKASFTAPGHSEMAREIAAQIILQGAAPSFLVGQAENISIAGQLSSFKALGEQVQPPKAEVKKAASVSADEIADNFLSMFG